VVKMFVTDMGWRVAFVIRVNRVIRFKLPIPLRAKTIRYSFREQGLINSLKNRLRVPPGCQGCPTHRNCLGRK
jgi:hypothetical protein